MAELKTQPTSASVDAFINSITDELQQRDAQVLLTVMRDATGERPTMWGTSMVGFGSYHYTYASGRDGHWFLTGFSPRRRSMTLYIMDGFDGYAALLGKLGKHSNGKSCLYIRRLDDVDLEVLSTLVRRSVRHLTDSAKE